MCFFNDTETTGIFTLSRQYALPILSKRDMCREIAVACGAQPAGSYPMLVRRLQERFEATAHQEGRRPVLLLDESHELRPDVDRKSTRLNSRHANISYAVFCLKKKNK